MDTLIRTEVYKGCKIHIHADYNAANPREDENLGTMVCFPRRYNLGDKHTFSLEEAPGIEVRSDVISLPLYLYDHSGLTMNTTGFSCRWDSGKVGFIYVTHNKVREEYRVKRVGKKLRERVRQYLKNEVKTYDKWLTGSFVGFVIEWPEGGDLEEDDMDSCWGFDNVEYMVEECKSTIDNHWKNRIKKRQEERAEERRMKAWNAVFDKFYAPILF